MRALGRNFSGSKRSGNRGRVFLEQPRGRMSRIRFHLRYPSSIFGLLRHKRLPSLYENEVYSPGRAGRVCVVHRLSQCLAVRELHMVAVRIMDDAEIPGTRIQKSGSKLQ